jgi:ATP-dependent Zn protease
VDEESAKIINGRYDEVVELLRRHEGLLHAIAEKLLEVEVLEKAQFKAMIEAFSNGMSSLAGTSEAT